MKDVRAPLKGMLLAVMEFTIMTLHGKGHSHSDIARIMNRSVQRISQIIKKNQPE